MMLPLSQSVISSARKRVDSVILSKEDKKPLSEIESANKTDANLCISYHVVPQKRTQSLAPSVPHQRIPPPSLKSILKRVRGCRPPGEYKAEGGSGRSRQYVACAIFLSIWGYPLAYLRVLWYFSEYANSPKQ